MVHLTPPSSFSSLFFPFPFPQTFLFFTQIILRMHGVYCLHQYSLMFTQPISIQTFSFTRTMMWKRTLNEENKCISSSSCATHLSTSPARALWRAISSLSRGPALVVYCLCVQRGNHLNVNPSRSVLESSTNWALKTNSARAHSSWPLTSWPRLSQRRNRDGLPSALLPGGKGILAHRMHTID